MHYWVNGTKYYKLLLQPNLFGNTYVICCWGRSGTRRGGYKVIRCDTQVDIGKVIAEVIKRRKARGYEVVTETNV